MTADPAPARSAEDFAVDLADFLLALQAVDPAGGPGPGQHNWFRGGPLLTYDDQARRALDALPGSGRLRRLWASASAEPGPPRPVWFHGDVAAGNLLVDGGRLSAVIDFGTCGVGDPACDLAVAWTLLTGPARAAFRDRLGVGDGTWARGRGWALWKALAGAVGDPAGAAEARRVLTEIDDDT